MKITFTLETGAASKVDRESLLSTIRDGYEKVLSGDESAAVRWWDGAATVFRAITGDVPPKPVEVQRATSINTNVTPSPVTDVMPAFKAGRSTPPPPPHPGAQRPVTDDVD